MSILLELPQKTTIKTISAPTNIFSSAYLIPTLHQYRVFWYLVENDYQIKKTEELISWWLKENKINSKIQVWFSGLPPAPSLLFDLVHASSLIIICAVENWQQKITEPKYWQRQIIELAIGTRRDPYQLRKELIQNGYQINNLADQPGLLAPRGSILDIYSPQNNYAYRLEFELSQLISIAIIENNLVTKKINKATIIPLLTNNIHLQKVTSYLDQNHCALVEQKHLELNLQWQNLAIKTLFVTTPLQQRNSSWTISDLPILTKNYTALKKYWRQQQELGYQFNFIAPNKKNLDNFFSELQMPGQQIFTFSPFTFSGFCDQKNKKIFITSQDIFGQELKEKNKQEIFLPDINVGDYVVHRDHGVARFTQLTQQTIDGVTREYLILAYAEQDRLYLPIDQADKISKYLGVTEPKLHRLGQSSTWPQTIRKIKEEVLKLAQELLNLYARRQLIKAASLQPHPLEENKLSHDFPYAITKDQQQALNDTLQDLEKNKPADRLICGDVGFGKTEIALRASWRAVLNKRQVVLLCPTTILAQQHFDTFMNRLEKYEVRIALLSRFMESNKQEKVIQDIATGQIDIIIGTHRLLSKDIHYHKIGLIIIDEEQQFGVKDKEKLKQLRTSAHILTMSATPLPRTLNMGLTGLRDISIIATPPVGRQPIKTMIQPHSNEIIYAAIQQEIERRGQVYYLYNKVETIQGKARELQKLLPHVSFGIVHGKLPAKELATTMHDFDANKIQVLICSTIIANGLDIANANTLIVDGAQNFGLAQLYQIRGRIGRSEKNAYAYFLYHSLKLKGKAGERLRALQMAEELGSGFQIAMKDMEMRGLGNILGKDQHGHASLIGFSLYSELLQQTISEIKNGFLPTSLLDSKIDLPLNMSIPTNLIPNPVSRLKLYQHLSSATDLPTLEKTFGQIPKPWPETVQNLYQQFQIKILAQQAEILSVIVQKDALGKQKLIIDFKNELDYNLVSKLLNHNQYWEFKEQQLKIDFNKLPKDWIADLKKVITLFNIK